MSARLVDDHGQALEAEYHVEADGGQLGLILESRSGMPAGRPPRNPDYNRAQTVLLTRLGALKAGPEAGAGEPTREPFSRTTSHARRTSTDKRTAIIPAHRPIRMTLNGLTGIYGSHDGGTNGERTLAGPAQESRASDI